MQVDTRLIKYLLIQSGQIIPAWVKQITDGVSIRRVSKVCSFLKHVPSKEFFIWLDHGARVMDT